MNRKYNFSIRENNEHIKCNFCLFKKDNFLVENMIEKQF